MKLIYFLLTIVMAIPGYAQEPKLSPAKMATAKSEMQLYMVNPELRYERGNSQDLVDRKPMNLAFAYKYKKISILAEYSRFMENTGNVTSSIERTHQDFSLWFRHHFLETKSRKMIFSLFGDAGVGAFDEEVKTTLMGDSRTDKSPAKFMTGLGVGGDLAVNLTEGFDFIVAVEGRTLLASEFDPNPVWSALLRLGFSFHL